MEIFDVAIRLENQPESASNGPLIYFPKNNPWDGSLSSYPVQIEDSEPVSLYVLFGAMTRKFVREL